MSLTSVLSYKDKRLKAFRALMSKDFPKPTIDKKRPILVESISDEYRLIGRSFDYLLRFSLENKYKDKVHASDWVVNYVIEQLIKRKHIGLSLNNNEMELLDSNPDLFYENVTAREKHMILARNYILDNFQRYKNIIQQYVMNELDLVKDVILASLFLGRLEELYRNGFNYLDSFSLQEDESTVDELFNIIKNSDLSLFQPAKSIILNPEFGNASSLVGGADADLIVDDLLIEIKVTRHLVLERAYFNQLIGYYLLYLIDGISNHPEAKINRIGIYFARHNYLWSMSLSDLNSFDKFEEAKEMLIESLTYRPRKK